MAADPIRTAIFNALAADSTLSGLVSDRIYFQRAPSSATYPLVIFFKSSGRPRRAFGDHFQDEVWTVRATATGTTSATKAEEIAAAFDAVLDDAALTITGRAHLSTLRESDGPSYAEIDAGTLYRHEPRLYRIFSE